MQRILIVGDESLHTALRIHLQPRRLVHVGLVPSWPLALAMARVQRPVLIVCSGIAFEGPLEKRWQEFKTRSLEATRLLVVADDAEAREPLDEGCRLCAPDTFLETAVGMLDSRSH